jgi:hypothetical protein
MRPLAFISLIGFFVIASFGISATTYSHALHQVSCPGTLPIGALFTCTITQSGDIDTYSFSALAEDTFIVRVFGPTGTFSPRIKVLDPDGISVQGCDTFTNNTQVAGECLLIASGTYQLQIKHTNNGLGLYQAYTQILNRMSNTSPVVYGQTIEPTIANRIESDSYTIDANPGDLVHIRAIQRTGAVTPSAYVYDNTGVRICGTFTNNTRIGFDCTFVKGGRYYLLFNDSSLNGIGGYRLYVQRLNNPGNTTPLTYGRVTQDTIDTNFDMDSYTFLARAGDVVKIRVAGVVGGGNLGPDVDVYNTQSVRVCGLSSNNSVVEFTCPISTAGTYALFIDSANSGAGKYTILVQRPEKVYLPLIKR